MSVEGLRQIPLPLVRQLSLRGGCTVVFRCAKGSGRNANTEGSAAVAGRSYRRLASQTDF